MLLVDGVVMLNTETGERVIATEYNVRFFDNVEFWKMMVPEKDDGKTNFTTRTI